MVNILIKILKMCSSKRHIAINVLFEHPYPIILAAATVLEVLFHECLPVVALMC